MLRIRRTGKDLPNQKTQQSVRPGICPRPKWQDKFALKRYTVFIENISYLMSNTLDLSPSFMVDCAFIVINLMELYFLTCEIGIAQTRCTVCTKDQNKECDLGRVKPSINVDCSEIVLVFPERSRSECAMESRQSVSCHQSYDSQLGLGLDIIVPRLLRLLEDISVQSLVILSYTDISYSSKELEAGQFLMHYRFGFRDIFMVQIIKTQGERWSEYSIFSYLFGSLF